MNNCIYCQNGIDQDRLDFLIETNRRLVCVGCSSESRAVEFMNFEHKTAPQLVMCPANARETIRIMNRANRRSR